MEHAVTHVSRVDPYVGRVLARIATFAIDGIDPRHVAVEVDIRSGLPAFTIVGLGDAAVRESRDRVRSAILNSRFEFPQTRITANLAPAFLRKVGPGFDAALALENRLDGRPGMREAVARWRTRRFDRAVRRAITRERPDAAFLFSDVGSEFALPACRRLGVPSILSMVHGDVRE
ncbi:MAG: magnesium chelatase domain-containing protein, partial [Solirubrobacteraceae bacterium]